MRRRRLLSTEIKEATDDFQGNRIVGHRTDNVQLPKSPFSGEKNQY